MNWMEFTLSILAGLTAAIPLVCKLIEYVKKATREKNWPAMLDMVMTYMEMAEKKFEVGTDKKEWVIAMVQASADTVNYDIDLQIIGKMIDDLCSMSNVINPPAQKAGE